MSTEEALKKETEKWLARAEKEFEKTELKDSAKDDLLRNARNYVKDCKYFISKQDWVRAFEAVIYAYGILDTLKRLGVVRINEK